MKFDVKRIAIVMMAVFFLAGCAGTPQQRRDKSLARAKQLLQKKDYKRALLELKNALRAMPNDAETYYQLGIGYLELRDGSMAYAAFMKAVALNPKHVGARLKVAQLLSTQTDPEALKQAERRLNELIQGGTPTTEMLNSLAFTELKLGKSQDAATLLEQALAQAPQEVSSAVMLAQTKVAAGDSQGAETVLRKLCADSPKSAEARRYLAELYLAQNKRPEAEKTLQEALSLDAQNGFALLDLARLQDAEGRKQEAEQSFRRLSSIDGYRSSHAIYLFDTGRGAEAIREFEHLAKDNPDDRQMRTNLVIAYRKTNRGADAEKVLENALKKNSKDADARLQRAEVEIEKTEYSQAQLDLNQVLKLRPAAPEVHYVIAKLNLLQGRPLTYRQELASALNLNHDLLQVRVELANSYLGAKQYQAALDLLDDAPTYQRATVSSIVERNWALWGLNEMTQMRKGIDQGLAAAKTPDLLIQDGLWKARNGDMAGARASLEQALNLDPTDIRALDAIRRTYVAQKNPALAVQKVKEYAAAHPKSAEIQDFLGMMLLSAGDKTQARAAFEASKAASPGGVSEDLRLVQMDVAQGKVDDAEKRLQGILAQDGANRQAQLWLGNLEEMKGQHDLALSNFQRVAANEPNNAQAQNNVAYLLIDKQPEEALKYAQKAVALVPDRPAYCDTLGWVLYQKGLYSVAIPYLERAASDKADPVWTYHLAMAYAKSGDQVRSRRTLDAALKLNPNLPEAKTAQGLLRRN